MYLVTSIDIVDNIRVYLSVMFCNAVNCAVYDYIMPLVL